MDIVRSARSLLSGVLIIAMTSTSFAQAVGDRAYFRYRGGATSSVAPGEEAPKDPLTIIGAPASVRARIGVPFSLVFTAQGASGSIAWRIASGSLPAGLALDPSTGILSGVPTTLGNQPGVSVAALDAAGATGSSSSFSVDVSPVPVLSVAASSSAAAGTAFSLTPNVTNVFGSRTFSLQGVLPFGLGLNAATGEISGSPEQDGTFGDLRLGVVDADGASGVSNSFTITVASTMRVSGYAVQNSARANSTFSSSQPALVGGQGVATWALASGALPAGLRLNETNGVISGTPTTVGDASGVYVRATDAAGKSIVSPRLSFLVAGEPTVAIMDGFRRLGSSHSIRPTVTNSIGASTWSLYSGSLPSGVKLNASTGEIYGTAASAGVATSLQLQRIDNFDGKITQSNPFSVETFPKLSISAPSVPTLRVGSPVDIAAPSIRGLRGAPTYSLLGTRPTGLNFIAATGHLSGTPLQAQTQSVIWQVVDSYDNASDATANAKLTVTAIRQPGDLQISGLSDSYVSTPGRLLTTGTPLVSNASGAVTFSIASGTLPTWATLNVQTGQIYGTPSAVGTFPDIVLRAADASGKATTAAAFQIVVRNAGVTFAISGYQSSYNAPTGSAFSSGRPFIDGASPSAVTFSVAQGALPTWAALDPRTGEIFGTPTAVGASYGIVIQALDAVSGSTTRSAALDIASVTPGSTPLELSGVPESYLAPSRRSFLSAPPTVYGSTSTLAFEIASGSLPSWASLNPATGQISGAPVEVTRTAGLSLRAREVSTGKSALSRTFFIDVTTSDPLIARAPTSLTGVFDVAFSTAPSSQNAQGAVTWSVAEGELPSWARLNAATGVISGTPNAVGVTEGLSLLVTDSLGSSAPTPTFSITVDAPPPLSIAAGPTEYFAQQASGFSTAAPRISNARGAVTFASAGSALPTGLSVNSTTGVISGAASTVGAYAGIALRAVDSQGVSATSEPFKITVSVAPLKVTNITDTYRMRVGTDWTMGTPGVDGAQGAVSWSLTGGAKPPFAAFDDSIGVLSGTSIAGSWSGLVIQATEADTGRVAQSAPFSVISAPAAPTIIIGKIQSLRSQTPFSVTLRADILLGAPTWSVASGSLPANVTLNATTGVISGTPAAIASTTATFRVVDAFDGASGTSAAIEFDVADGTPTVAYGEVLQGRAGQLFTKTPVVNYATGQNRFTMAAGRLPNWATLDATTGVISGRPTSAMTGSDYQVALTDGRGVTGESSAFDIQIAPDLAVVLASPDFVARPNLSLSTPTPTVTGARGDVTWTLNGSLPSGVSLDSRSGVISGVFSATGVYPVTLTVRDGFDGVSKTAALRISVIADPTVSVANVAARVGFPLEVTPQTANIVGATTWTLSGAVLPTGLNLDATTGKISGSPQATGIVSGFILKVTDAQGRSGQSTPFSISVSPKIQIAIGTTEGRVGKSFTTGVPSVTGATGSSNFTLSGALPNWLSINPATGEIKGVPTEAMSLSGLVLRVTDASGVAGASDPFTLAFTSNPSISYAALTPRLNASLSASPTLTGVIGAGSFALASGSLPANVVIDPVTGRITGRPTALSAASNVTVRVTDSEGASGVSEPFSIQVVNGITIVAQPTAKTGRAGYGFSMDLPAVTGTSGTIVWSFAPNQQLPSGLTFNGQKLEGIPSRVGTYTLTLRATDNADGATVDAQPFTLTVLSSLVASIPSASVYGHTGLLLTGPTPVVQNKRGTVTWTVGAGTLPANLTVNAATGVISGTPTAAADVSGLKLKATDGADGATGLTEAFRLTVTPPVAVSGMATRYTARFGYPFTQARPSLDNALGAVTWSLESGTLPGWATLDAATGVLVGTPDSLVQVANLSIRGRDSANGTAVSVKYSLQAYSEPAASIAQGSYNIRVGATVEIQPTSDGVFGSESWSISQGRLPAGLTIDPSTGRIFGVPTAAENQPIRIRLTDTADGKISEVATQINVSPTLIATGLKPAYSARAGGFLATDFLNVTGAVGQRTISVTASGGVVPGPVLNQGNGAFSGTVNGNATQRDYLMVFTVTDPFDGAKVTLNSTITVIGSITISGTGDYSVREGGALTGPTPKAGNILGAPAWSLALPASLPSGLSIDPATGRVVGSPAASFTVFGPVRIRATDTDGANASSGDFYLRYNAPLTVSDPTTIDATVGVNFTASLTANSAYGGVTWSQTGLPSPPFGISGYGTNGNEGRITGIPSVAGEFPVEVTATHRLDYASITKTFTVVVQSLPQITMAPISTIRGKSVDARPSAVYVDDGAVTYVLSEGSSATQNVGTGANFLPAGLQFEAATGRIYGAPTAVFASRTFRIKAVKTKLVGGVSKDFVSVEKSFSITVGDWAKPVVAHMGVIRGNRGSDYATPAPVVTNVAGKLTFALWRGAYSGSSYVWSSNGLSYLPAGLTFDANTGIISGKSTNPNQDVLFRVQALDARTVNGVTDTATSDATISTASPYVQVTIDDWALPTVADMPNMVTKQGSFMATPAPVVTNAMGTLTYQLVKFTYSGGSYFASNIAAPTGLTFDASTGILSGYPEDTFDENIGIVALDRRTVNGVSTTVASTSATSSSIGAYSFSLRIQDWGPPVIADQANFYPVRGVYAETAAPQVSNVLGTLSYRLYVGVYNSSTRRYSWNSAGTSNLPTGVTFSATTGVISGAAEAEWGNAPYHIQPIDTRVVNTKTFTVPGTLPAEQSTPGEPSFYYGVPAWSTPEAASIGTQAFFKGSAVSTPAPAISNTSGTVKYELYRYTLSGSRYNKSLITTMPAGLAFNTDTGVISGASETVFAEYWAIGVIDTRTVNGKPFPVPSTLATNVSARPSESFYMNSQDWVKPAVVDNIANLTVTRGEYGITAAPAVTAAQGTVTFALWYGTFASSRYTWNQANASTLPKGMTFDANTGRISGIPEVVSGTYLLSVQAIDARTINGKPFVERSPDPTNNTTRFAPSFYLYVNNWALPSIGTMPTVNFTRGQYSATATPSVSGILGAATFSLNRYYQSGSTWYLETNSVPPLGLTFDASTGVLSGRPETLVGVNYYYAIGVSDLRYVNGNPYTEVRALPNSQSTRPSETFQASFNDWAKPLVTQPGTLQMYVNKPASSPTPSVANIQGTPTYRLYYFYKNGSTWNFAGGQGYLPPNVTFDPVTGRISGTPTSRAGDGGYFQISVVDRRLINQTYYTEEMAPPPNSSTTLPASFRLFVDP